MASPLLPYANAIVRATVKGTVSVVNGRLVEDTSEVYLYRCFLKRIQYTGVSSGSVKQPLPSQLDGQMMPGASGDQFFYRGYYLQKVQVDDTFDWLGDLSALSWVDVTDAEQALLAGSSVEFLFGTDVPIRANVERSTGVFGGQGIDAILYKELGGVQLQLTGAEIQS